MFKDNFPKLFGYTDARTEKRYTFIALIAVIVFLIIFIASYYI